MKRLDNYILKYFIYFSPFMIIPTIALEMNSKIKGYITGEGPLFTAWAVLGILWCVSFMYVMFSLVFNEKLKNIFIRKLARIRENDEREAQITGTISKKTFISSIAVLLLFIFLSVVNVHLYRASKEEVPKGNRGVLFIGADLKFFEPTPNEKKNEPAGRNYYVNYNGLPLSSDGTLILVLCIQMGLFYYFSRKEFES